MATACKKINANDPDDEGKGDKAVENDLPQNTYSINGKSTTAGFSVYSSLKSNSFSNCSRYTYINYLYVNFSGRTMPKTSGIYNAVTQKAIVTVENGKVNIMFTDLELYGTNDPAPAPFTLPFQYRPILRCNNK